MMSSASSLETKGNALFTPYEAKDCENQDKGCGKSQRTTEFDMLKISQSLINISL
jgi:hypothetical protein